MPWSPDPYGSVPAPLVTICMRYRQTVARQVEPAIKEQLRSYCGYASMQGQPEGNDMLQETSVPQEGVYTLLKALNSIPGVQAYKRLV